MPDLEIINGPLNKNESTKAFEEVVELCLCGKSRIKSMWLNEFSQIYLRYKAKAKDKKIKTCNVSLLLENTNLTQIMVSNKALAAYQKAIESGKHTELLEKHVAAENGVSLKFDSEWIDGVLLKLEQVWNDSPQLITFFVNQQNELNLAFKDEEEIIINCDFLRKQYFSKHYGDRNWLSELIRGLPRGSDSIEKRDALCVAEIYAINLYTQVDILFHNIVNDTLRQNKFSWGDTFTTKENVPEMLLFVISSIGIMAQATNKNFFTEETFARNFYRYENMPGKLKIARGMSIQINNGFTSASTLSLSQGNLFATVPESDEIVYRGIRPRSIAFYAQKPSEAEVLIPSGTQLSYAYDKDLTDNGDSVISSVNASCISSVQYDLIDTYWLREAILNAYTSLISPYTDADICGIDLALKIDGAQIERPNHGLAHTTRVVMLVAAVTAYYSRNATSEKFREFCKYLPLKKLNIIQCVLSFLVVGRESEISYHDDPDLYLLYRETSAAKFKIFIQLTGLEISDSFLLEELMSLFQHVGDPNYTYPQHQEELQFILQIMNFSHNLDLVRCLDADTYRHALSPYIEGATVSENADYYELIRYTLAMNRITGDRLLVDLNDQNELVDVYEDYQMNFLACSTDPNYCFHRLADVELPSFMPNRKLSYQEPCVVEEEEDDDEDEVESFVQAEMGDDKNLRKRTTSSLDEGQFANPQNNKRRRVEEPVLYNQKNQLLINLIGYFHFIKHHKDLDTREAFRLMKLHLSQATLWLSRATESNVSDIPLYAVSLLMLAEKINNDFAVIESNTGDCSVSLTNLVNLMTFTYREYHTCHLEFNSPVGADYRT